MVTPARTVNDAYIRLMGNAKESRDGQKGLARIRDLWWPHFLQAFGQGPLRAIDNLDLCMEASRQRFERMAGEYAKSNESSEGSSSSTQRSMQFMKSNTGKMFERFIGLAIAHYLKEVNSRYAVWAFRNDITQFSPKLHPANYSITVMLGNVSYETPMDSDLAIFNPTDLGETTYLASVKSTLKDRFHNVPFWQLLRRAALSHDFLNIQAKVPGLLEEFKYVGFCTDLAEEQPDFSNVSGPRNLLCLDAALLDGAYVTASKAKGLGQGDNHFGPQRDAPFYPLSKFVEMLS